MNFKIQFPESKIDHWAARYEYQGEEKIIDIGKKAQEKGYLMKDEFLKICEWKTQRSKSRCKKNKEKDVEIVTRAAFSVKSNDIKIKLLCSLHGVEWATASTILHFCDKENYPIFDYRALWSLGVEKPNVFSCIFWDEYKEYIEGISLKYNKTFRVIDRALWQYSKEHQKGT